MADSVISMRQYYKRNKVLNIIRLGENVSRYDVKKLTMYSISTVSDIIAELIRDGLVYEEECQEARVGRKPIWLRLNPGGAYFVGVEFNAQMLHCAMLNLVGEIVYTHSEAVEQETGSDEIMANIIANIHKAMDSVPGGREHVSGICVGVPGYTDKQKGLAISYTHLKNWENVPVRDILHAEFGLPCYIDNNINVMAFAYKWLYYNGDAKDFIFVSMRMGVRMVPFINNQLILSQRGVSGELGHIHVSEGSRSCSCGRYGCLNSEISNSSLLSIIREGLAVGRYQQLLEMAGGDAESLTIGMFCDSVLQGHYDSVMLMKRTARYLGQALSTVANLFAPQVIVLSGDLTGMGEVFTEEVYREMAPLVVTRNLENLSVSVSAFDKDIGAVGAAALVIQQEFEIIDKPI